MDHSAIDEDPNKSQLPRSGPKWRITCDCLPKRYLLAILSFLGFLNVTALRVNLSVALVAMVSSETNSTASGDVKVLKAAEFNWTSREQGIILSSSFYGYMVAQIPGGYLAARFGGKNIFGGGVLISALLTLLTPLAARGSMYLLIAIRALDGFFKGLVFPCRHAIWIKWAPPMERSKLSSITSSGLIAGIVFGMMFSGLIADSFGWPAVFYFFGVMAIIWSALWFWLVTDSPLDHPTITDKELNYLKTELAEDQTEKKTGFLSALPYLVMIVVVPTGGRLADLLRTRKILSTTAVRKIFNSLGFLFAGLFLLLVGYAPNKDIAVLELTLAVGFSGLSRSGFMVNHLDIAPRYAGLLYGITNCLGTIPGILSPPIVGIITKNETNEEWRYVFIISSIMYLFGLVFFLIFSSGEKQPWAQSDENPTMNENNVATIGTSETTIASVV